MKSMKHGVYYVDEKNVIWNWKGSCLWRPGRDFGLCSHLNGCDWTLKINVYELKPSSSLLSTQSPECERGRGDHKLLQPYGQPSPGAGQLLCCYCYMDLRGYDILVVFARTAWTGRIRKGMIVEEKWRCWLHHHRVSCCVVLMLLAESAAMHWNPVLVTAMDLYGLLHGLTLKWVPPYKYQVCNYSSQ